MLGQLAMENLWGRRGGGIILYSLCLKIERDMSPTSPTESTPISHGRRGVWTKVAWHDSLQEVKVKTERQTHVTAAPRLGPHLRLIGPLAHECAVDKVLTMEYLPYIAYQGIATLSLFPLPISISGKQQMSTSFLISLLSLFHPCILTLWVVFTNALLSHHDIFHDHSDD